MRRAVSVVALLVVVAAGCGGSSSPSASRDDAPRTTTSVASPTTTAPVSPTTAVAAPAPPPGEGATRRVAGRARIPLVAVFDSPGAAKPARTLRNPVPEGYPLAFLVEEQRPDGWLRVSLPTRPNGATGWVQAVDLELWEVHGRVLVEVGARRLRYWQGTELVLDVPIAVGTSRTPTPLGRFFVDIIAQPRSPRGPYGPYQVSVTGFSEVLRSFGGGQGQIALHGTNRPDLLGRDVSNGCVRLRNDAITRLAERVAIGTPVDIVA